MNIIIIICSIAVTLYVIAETYTLISGWVAEWKLEAERKKKHKSEIYQFKVKKILLTAYNHALQSGLSKKQSRQMAFRYTHDVENAQLVNEKYELIKQQMFLNQVRSSL